MARAPKQSFSVDVVGLLEALTEQFPEPLLCVRELIQNAADAGAKRIETDVAYDEARGLLRLSVRDDGRGMNEREVEGYLTIGFSKKDPDRHRGRFGVGKLSPYALGIQRMIVETCDGTKTHRMTFNPDGSGTIARMEVRPRGTVVKVYKPCDREEAEQLSERSFALVRETCGSIAIPLYVNGTPVNRDIALPTIYALPFTSVAGTGVLGVTAEPVHSLMGGGILLETDAAILGPEVSYILDSPRLAPTLSRNAVRRDQAFDELLRAARARMPAFVAHVARQLRVRADRLRAEGAFVERGLDDDDRAALEWLRRLLLTPEDEAPEPVVRDAPVLETANGNLVSANELVEVIRREGRVPISRVPRTSAEIAGYEDRGVPVLLLYRDLEDFLDRQAIPTVEVDGLDDGIEIAEIDWGRGEAALAARPTALKDGRFPWPAVALGATVAAAVVAGVLWLPSAAHEPASEVAQAALQVRSGERGQPGSQVNLPKVSTPPEATAADLMVPPQRQSNGSTLVLALLVAILSGAAGIALIWKTLTNRRRGTRSWLRAEAGAPLMVGDSRTRRWNVLSRALFNPVDFLVARGWSVRAAGAKPLSASHGIHGYRELAPEAPIRSGVRLDLDMVNIGFVDLMSESGDASDGRIVLVRDERVLLNRNHPTIRDLIHVAEADPTRARMLLDILLATDPDLARGTDPRQVEWDLLGRAEQSVRRPART